MVSRFDRAAALLSTVLLAVSCGGPAERPASGPGMPCWRDDECSGDLVCRDDVCSWPPRPGEVPVAGRPEVTSPRASVSSDEVAACAHLYALMVAELGDAAPGPELREECAALLARERERSGEAEVKRQVDCLLGSKTLDVARACVEPPKPEPSRAGPQGPERRPSRWLCEAFAAKLVGLTTIEAGADPDYALEHGSAFVTACLKEASFEDVACVLAAETIEDIDEHCP